jgi:uncharacterized membrane protein
MEMAGGRSVMASQLTPGWWWVGGRQIIRDALHEDGIAQRIDELVAELLIG